MSRARTHSRAPEILPPPGAAVKARIIAAGLSMSIVAGRARIAKSTLSDYLSGRLRNVYTQIDVVMAFNALTGQTLSVREFWGPLTAEEAA